MINLLLFENFDVKKEEHDFIEDLLLELIDKYKMVPMEMEEGCYEFNNNINNIQYHIAFSQLTNKDIYIYFESHPSLVMNDLFDDIKFFTNRIQKYKYKVNNCVLNKAGEHDHMESIIIRISK